MLRMAGFYPVDFHNTMIDKIFVTLVDKSGFDSCRFVDIQAKAHPELK